MSSPKKVKSDTEQSDTSSEDIGHLQDLDFARKSRWTDLQLKVEGQDLYVPKSHLALVSPVFRLMFESDFKEKDIDVLSLPGKKYEDVLTFLKFTHPGIRLKVTYDITPKVLPLAHEYQVQWLLDDCTNVMLMEMDASKFSALIKNDGMTSSTVAVATASCNICIMAEKYGLNSVINRFIDRFSSINYKHYKDLPEFKAVSAEVRYRLLCGRLDSTEKTLNFYHFDEKGRAFTNSFF